MSFTVDDFQDLLRLLNRHPEWKAELRRQVLSDELLNLPDLVRNLIVAHTRAEERLERLEDLAEELIKAHTRAEERLSRLEEAQLRAEERLSRLEDLAEELIKAHARAEERLSRLEAEIAALTAVQRRLEETVRELAESMRRFETRMQRFEDRLNKVVGRTLEMEYREKAHAFFGRWLRRPRVVSFNDLWDELEARLTPEEFDDLRVLDLIVTGRPRLYSNVPGDVWLAIEVSAVVDTGDTERARRRAGLLHKAGFPAIPVVAGEVAVPEVEIEARTHHIAVLQDGSSSFWEEALAAWIPTAAA